MHSEADRITDLELLMTHLQRELEQMHSVILSQQTEIKELSVQLANLKSEVDQNLPSEENRIADDERPPHY